jgi:hypothetical protein
MLRRDRAAELHHDAVDHFIHAAVLDAVGDGGVANEPRSIPISSVSSRVFRSGGAADASCTRTYLHDAVGERAGALFSPKYFPAVVVTQISRLQSKERAAC